MDEILVLVEHRNGEIRDITFELLTLASRLAAENQMRTTSLLLGYETAEMAGRLNHFCDELVVLDAPELAAYNPDPYLSVLEKIVRERKPPLTMIGHTAVGMELAPVLGARLCAPLATDCLEASLSDGRLTVQRRLYGGKVNARLTLKLFDQYLLTLQPGNFPLGEGRENPARKTMLNPPVWPRFKRRFLGYVEAALEDLDITGANILVSIGRGIGKPEHIPIAQEFADAIGAVVSCSRPVADKGWLPKSRQVGTSGKTVRPDIYIALGISGAFQHQAGMKNSGTIIAVNKDPRAPIFNVAHYGVVGDLFQVLPVLKEKFSK